MKTVDILYEDADIIVVVKPPGMPSQAESGTALDMVSYLKNYLAKKGFPIHMWHRFTVWIVRLAVLWFMPGP